MKIREAILQAREKKRRIYSRSLGMYSQDAKSLIHWIFVAMETKEQQSLKKVEKYLAATDWKLEKKGDLDANPRLRM